MLPVGLLRPAWLVRAGGGGGEDAGLAAAVGATAAHAAVLMEGHAMGVPTVPPLAMRPRACGCCEGGIATMEFERRVEGEWAQTGAPSMDVDRTRASTSGWLGRPFMERVMASAGGGLPRPVRGDAPPRPFRDLVKGSTVAASGKVFLHKLPGLCVACPAPAPVADVGCGCPGPPAEGTSFEALLPPLGGTGVEACPGARTECASRGRGARCARDVISVRASGLRWTASAPAVAVPAGTAANGRDTGELALRADRDDAPPPAPAAGAVATGATGAAGVASEAEPRGRSPSLGEGHLAGMPNGKAAPGCTGEWLVCITDACAAMVGDTGAVTTTVCAVGLLRREAAGGEPWGPSLLGEGWNM
mmetsp:Transcript_11127/g.34835  ORF Transcript_11127/g.34835 Transcript_11127/m.34835 type:complete len:361 (-) Transcript_11127:453-1535(-)